MGDEPAITINGVHLTSSQAMAVRVAVTDFHATMQSEGVLGKDSLGERLRQAYLDRLNEVMLLMVHRQRPEAP